jgi:hypothetical protein
MLVIVLGAGGWGASINTWYSSTSNQELMEDMARQGMAWHGMTNVNSEQASAAAGVSALAGLV